MCAAAKHVVSKPGLTKLKKPLLTHVLGPAVAPLSIHIYTTYQHQSSPILEYSPAEKHFGHPLPLLSSTAEFHHRLPLERRVATARHPPTAVVTEREGRMGSGGFANLNYKHTHHPPFSSSAS